MTEYSMDTARTRFVFGHPEWEIEIQGAEHISADFDRFIRKVKAEAWAEGQHAGWCEGYSHGEPADNPYL